jgi:hypothetical protein
MSFIRTSVIAAVASVALGAVASAATIANITGTDQAATFTSFHGGGAGTHGVEIRGGRARAADWELGLGSATSQNNNPATFTQREIDWGTGPTTYGFSYVYSDMTTTFSLLDISTEAVVTSASWDGLKTGNAIQIFANRSATITVGEINGLLFGDTIGAIGNTSGSLATYFGLSLIDGFTMSGSVQVTGGGGSANLIFIKAGNVDVPAPIPLPAAAWMLLAGMAALGAAARKRARA